MREPDVGRLVLFTVSCETAVPENLYFAPLGAIEDAGTSVPHGES